MEPASRPTITMGRSRGDLTSKIHAIVVHLALTPGEAHDNRLCSVFLCALLPPTILLADRGYELRTSVAASCGG